MIKSRFRLSALGFLTAAVSFVLPVQSIAQQAVNSFGVEAGVSTLGVYLGPKVQISDRFAVRLPVYVGSQSTSRTVDDNVVTGKFDLASSALMADYHPFNGAFRMSGGVAMGGYEVTGSITNPVFNNRTYSGLVESTIRQTENTVPVVSFGYAKTFNNGFGILAEVGAKIGTYTLTASDTAIPNLLKAQFNADVAAANDDLQQIKATPFVTLGMSYRF